MTVLVETAPHEFAANLLFNERGLRPYFAADSRVKAGGGSQAGMFTYGGEEWRAKLYYQESGLEHPGKTTPKGTPFEIENLREFRFSIHSVDDTVGQRKFNAHLSPRWLGMKSKNGGEIPVPEGFGEGVNLRISGANIEFEEYLSLLRCAASSVGIQPGDFDDPHEYSNIQDAERYVRLHKDVSGPVHARDGPIAQMGHLLENDREGYRKVVQNDQTGRGEALPGYYHTVTLDQRRIQEAIPSHALPKEIKHYYAQEALSFPDGHPLRHPKLGASYQVNRWKGKLGVTTEDLEQLNRELEETVLSVLANAGIDLRPGGEVYVEDEYLSKKESERERQIVELNLIQIRQTQESVVIKHLADGLSPVEWDSLRCLVTDGGQVSPNNIAESTGYHPDSVRRALNRIDDLVEREYGSVSLRSNYVAELVHESVKHAQEATQRAVEASSKALEAASRGLDEKTSAFIAWAAKHDINFNERSSGVSLKLGKLDEENHRREVRRILREGLRLWEQAKRDPALYRAGNYRYQVEERANGLLYAESKSMTRTVCGKVWETIQ
ncbi:DUF7845 domain-containing protein [Haloferax volcanii]|uniref:DUF7845 domain-containing protein n=1 Tax=Haloferax volcanii TaxID=2246 RepID=UPI0023DC2329|nr:MarR family winged helix-turn-helix transcriptional regulator [Haloferax lucentense]WEL27342.1 Protein containing HTH domain [Haloferax lucentense]